MTLINEPLKTELVDIPDNVPTHFYASINISLGRVLMVKDKLDSNGNFRIILDKEMITKESKEQGLPKWSLDPETRLAFEIQQAGKVKVYLYDDVFYVMMAFRENGDVYEIGLKNLKLKPKTIEWLYQKVALFLNDKEEDS